MRTYKEILAEVASACKNVFYNGHKDIRASVVEAATKIYITELQIDYCNKDYCNKTADN